MIEPIHLAGSFTLPGASMTVNRMGYGAMQLAGPEVWGPPRDVDAAIAVLREAVESGVNHIDTSDYYGPHVTNQLIKKALHPCCLAKSAALLKVISTALVCPLGFFPFFPAR